MAFRGTVLPIPALLEHSVAPTGDSAALPVEPIHDAASNARACRQLLWSGASLDDAWRFGILQTLDDYTSILSRGGMGPAATVFAEEPPPTGAGEVDAAFAALADHLAERDGWQPPAWAHDPARRTERWYPAVPKIFRREADELSPRAFAARGIFLSTTSLDRA